MPFTVNETYKAVVMSISGKFLGSLEGTSFKEKIDELSEAGQKRIVVDLSKTDFMDSSGIGTLIGCLTTVRRSGGDIKLAGMAKRIRNLFLMTRLLGGVFDDYETVDDAIASFGDLE